MPATSTSPKWSSPTVARKRSSLKADEDCVIRREQFLVGHMLYMKKKDSLSPPAYHLWTEHFDVVSPTIRPAPPPGLAGLGQVPELELMPEKEKQPEPVVELPPTTPEEFKVLLQNLPEAMLKECMLRVMLEQAKLKDITNLVFRASGKALITFTSYESVVKCISHCHGRKWGSSSVPVVATYVKTVKRTDTPTEDEEPKQEAATRPRTMSADAPAFVPGGFQLSADAPTFVPPGEKMCTLRDRFYSYASTDIPADSDEVADGFGYHFDQEAPVVCTY